MRGGKEAGEKPQGPGSLPEKVTFEQRLWKCGGNRPGELGGRNSSQCKDPEVPVCTGTFVELEGGRSRYSRVSEGRGIESIPLGAPRRTLPHALNSTEPWRGITLSRSEQSDLSFERILPVAMQGTS